MLGGVVEAPAAALAQQLGTMLNLPLGRPIVAGRMTLDGGIRRSGDTRQVWLIIEVEASAEAVENHKRAE